jgi:hypothetical protein
MENQGLYCIDRNITTHARIKADSPDIIVRYLADTKISFCNIFKISPSEQGYGLHIQAQFRCGCWSLKDGGKAWIYSAEEHKGGI